MVRRTLKQAAIATTLFSLLAALMGCTSLVPKPEPTPMAAAPSPKVVRTTTGSKVHKPNKVVTKKVTAKKVIKPAEDEPPPPVIAPLGGGNGGSGGGGGW
jgi:hypothetical protein